MVKPPEAFFLPFRVGCYVIQLVHVLICFSDSRPALTNEPRQPKAPSCNHFVRISQQKLLSLIALTLQSVIKADYGQVWVISYLDNDLIRVILS